MTTHTTEADARIEIDDLLRVCGWDPKDKSQVRTEVSVTPFLPPPDGVGQPAVAYGDEAEVPPPSRRADYVLLGRNGRPLAVIEAKKRALEPYVAKQQALPYARAIGAPFIFLTNGVKTYFWDHENDDAREVAALYSRRDLERLVEMRTSRMPLATVPIPEYYQRNSETRVVRPYQREAMRALDHALELGKRRFLLELPTGTGKTDVVALYLKRLFEAGWAERVLVLVDREQLALQMVGALQDVLSAYSCYWLRPGVVRQEMQITVALLQTMIGHTDEYSAGYFDVVIADECHRSIYGSWQGALTRFDAVHIGLTATPAGYIERNTYDFYQCKPGQPDFAYRIQNAIAEGFLVPYSFATGITEIVAEGATVDGVEYDPLEFERTWTNDKSNHLMMQEFDTLAWQSYRELAPGQKAGPGKAVVFAITKHHAARLAVALNQLHPEHKGAYAEVITSDIADAQGAIKRFKNEALPMVAVSVGMLDTGFDCREVLHVVMCRRVGSPILYQQMRGRGMRTAPHIQKRSLVIYDFFRNHQRFNDDNESVFTGGRGGHAPGGGGGEGPLAGVPDLGLADDWLERVSYIEVGLEGERIDKKQYVTDWERTVRAREADDPLVRKVRDGAALTDEEEEALRAELNHPRNYFNEQNLRLAYRNPAGSLVDFLRAALGRLDLKSRDEILDEAFRAWLVTKALTTDQATYLSIIKNRGIATGHVKLDDLFKPPLSILNAAGLGVELFGEQGLKQIVEELDASVFKTARAS
jgi:type I restriction enzyme R subunit